MLKALDLFCGLGGWSDGLDLEGFKMLGVEIEPKIAKLYKHDVICADVQTLDGENFKGFDLIVGSPPCRDFSVIGRLWGHTWKRPPEPKYGLVNIYAFLEFIKNAHPKYWLMENVSGLQKYLWPARTETYLGIRTMKRCFWGTYPSFLIPQTVGKKVYSGMHRYQRDKRKKEGLVIDPTGHYSLSKWKAAKIPLAVARALGRSIKNNN